MKRSDRGYLPPSFTPRPPEEEQEEVIIFYKKKKKEVLKWDEKWSEEVE